MFRRKILGYRYCKLSYFLQVFLLIISWPGNFFEVIYCFGSRPKYNFGRNEFALNLKHPISCANDEVEVHYDVHIGLTGGFLDSLFVFVHRYFAKSITPKFTQASRKWLLARLYAMQTNLLYTVKRIGLLAYLVGYHFFENASLAMD